MTCDTTIFLNGDMYHIRVWMSAIYGMYLIVLNASDFFFKILPSVSGRDEFGKITEVLVRYNQHLGSVIQLAGRKHVT